MYGPCLCVNEQRNIENSVRVDDWTAELATIARYDESLFLAKLKFLFSQLHKCLRDEEHAPRKMI